MFHCCFFFSCRNMRLGLCIWLLACMAAAAPERPLSLKEDTTSTVDDESKWFHAADNFNFLARVAVRMSIESTPHLHCLDCFGASQRVKSCWEDAGYKCEAYDLKLNPQHDLSLFGGCVELIRLLFLLLAGGIIISGPPCSLMVAASQSVHRRTWTNLMGNIQNKRVRLSNILWSNYVVCLQVVQRIRKDLILVVEQPASSWAFKMPMLIKLAKEWNMCKLTTYMGCFGHDLEKCSHLLTNLQFVDPVVRSMTSALRSQIKERFQRRQMRRPVKKEYWRRTSSGKWCGGKHLADTASYTSGFCRALLQCWLGGAIVHLE